MTKILRLLLIFFIYSALTLLLSAGSFAASKCYFDEDEMMTIGKFFYDTGDKLTQISDSKSYEHDEIVLTRTIQISRLVLENNFIVMRLVQYNNYYCKKEYDSSCDNVLLKIGSIYSEKNISTLEEYLTELNILLLQAKSKTLQSYISGLVVNIQKQKIIFKALVARYN